MSVELKELPVQLANLKQNLQSFDINETDLNLQIIVKYQQWVIARLEQLFSQQELSEEQVKSFFNEHWQLVKYSQVSPTAIPQSDLILFLCELAKTIATPVCPPLAILMPGIMWQSVRDGYPDLDMSLNLPDVLRTHVLSDDARTLIPVALLNEPESLNHHFQAKKAIIYNPYFEEANYVFQAISSFEFLRLCQHTTQTQALASAIEHYANLLTNKTDLYSHLLALCHALKFNDSHAGIGREEKVGEGVFVGLVTFSDYFNQLSFQDKQRLPEPLKEALSHLLMVSSEPVVQTLSLFSLDEFRRLIQLVPSPAIYLHASERNYTTARFTGAQIRALEQALNGHELVNRLRPLNMVNLIYSCAGLRREEIEKSMHGHEVLLMSIHLEGRAVDTQKIQAFEKIQFLSKTLASELSANSYSGTDKKSLTVNLLKELDLSKLLEINHPSQLQLFKSMQPDEIDLVLSEFPYIKRQIINQFKENWTWISFFNDLSDSQLDTLLSHLADYLKWRSFQLYEALFCLHVNKHKVILKHFLNLFDHEEFLRFKPIPYEALIASVLELSAENMIRFIRKSHTNMVLFDQAFTNTLIEKIKLEPSVLLKEDFYKILGTTELCRAIIRFTEPHIVAELAGRYMDLGIHIHRESFIVLVEYLLNLSDKKYLLNLVSYINFEQLQQLMRSFKRDLIHQYLTALCQIECPKCFVPLIRLMHHLKVSEIHKYRLNRLIEHMALTLDLEFLQYLETNDFYTLYLKSVSIRAIGMLFARVGHTPNLCILFRHAINLRNVFNDFPDIPAEQLAIMMSLMDNLVENFLSLSSQHRKEIISHRLSFRLFQKFAPQKLKIIFGYLSYDELKEVFKRESNPFWRELFNHIGDYFSGLEDKLLVDVLALNTSSGSRLIDVIQSDIVERFVVERLKQNPQLVLNAWWILDNAVLSKQLLKLLDKPYLSQLMDNVFPRRWSYSGLCVALMDYLGQLNWPLDDDLLIDLLCKKQNGEQTWANYFLENFTHYPEAYEALKFRLNVIKKPEFFRALVELYQISKKTIHVDTISYLIQIGSSDIYESFAFEDFQNLMDLCVDFPYLSGQLPTLNEDHLKVFTQSCFTVYFDESGQQLRQGQDVLLHQVLDFLMSRLNDPSLAVQRYALIRDWFFETNFAVWVKLNAPQPMLEVIKLLNLEQLIHILKMIKHKFFYADFLPYLWVLFPEQTIEGLLSLDDSHSVLFFINQAPGACLTLLMDHYKEQHKKILKLVANNLDDRDVASCIGAHYKANLEALFANLLQDFKHSWQFFKLLESLLKQMGFVELTKQKLIKRVVIKRFMALSSENPHSFKRFFQYRNIQSYFDFNLWMGIFSEKKRAVFVGNIHLPAESFLMNQITVEQGQSVNYLLYTAKAYPDVAQTIIEHFQSNTQLYSQVTRNLFNNFMFEGDVIRLLNLVPALMPIFLNKVLESTLTQHRDLLQQHWLTNEEFLLTLIQCHPKLFDKIVGHSSHENIRIIKCTSKNFLLFSRVEAILEDHHYLISFLSNQLTTYDMRIHFFQKLHQYRTRLQQQHVLDIIKSEPFTLMILQSILKQQLLECLNLLNEKASFPYSPLHEKLFACVTEKEMLPRIDGLITELNDVLHNASRSLGYLKLRKSLSFFNSEQHDRLELQHKLLETQNLLIYYRTNYLLPLDADLPTPRVTCLPGIGR